MSTTLGIRALVNVIPMNPLLPLALPVEKPNTRTVRFEPNQFTICKLSKLIGIVVMLNIRLLLR